MKITWENKLEVAREISLSNGKYPARSNSRNIIDRVYFIDKMSVGEWINRENVKYRAGKLLDTQKVLWEQFLKDTLSCSRSGLSWNEKFFELRKQIEAIAMKSEGSARKFSFYSLNEFSDGSNVGVWAVSQRKQNAKGKLSESKRELWNELEQLISTFSKNLSWDDKALELQNFLISHLQMPEKGEKALFSDGTCISNWVHNQTVLASGGILSEEQCQTLMELKNLPFRLKLSMCVSSFMQTQPDDVPRSPREIAIQDEFSLLDESTVGMFFHTQYVRWSNKELPEERKDFFDDYMSLLALEKQHIWNYRVFSYLLKAISLGTYVSVGSTPHDFHSIGKFFDGVDMGNWFYFQRRCFRYEQMDDKKREIWRALESLLTFIRYDGRHPNASLNFSSLHDVFCRLQEEGESLANIYSEFSQHHFFKNYFFTVARLNELFFSYYQVSQELAEAKEQNSVGYKVKSIGSIEEKK